MTAKVVVARTVANEDVDEAVDYYLGEASGGAAHNFVDELETAYAHVSLHATSGSPRYAHELNLPGLRFWPVTRFPYLIFYFEREDVVDVWRVLHAQRDIPAWTSDT